MNKQKTMIDLIFLAIMSTLILAIIYCLYQMIRNEKVYKIRINWINNKDKRHDKYSYDYMLNPSLHNLYGLKLPKDSDYK